MTAARGSIELASDGALALWNLGVEMRPPKRALAVSRFIIADHTDRKPEALDSLFGDPGFVGSVKSLRSGLKGGTTMLSLEYCWRSLDVLTDDIELREP